MKYYETLMLVRTEATGDEISFLERSIDDRVTKANGSVNLFDKWGKLRLAYPVEKQEYGLYILSRYALPSEGVAKFLKDLDAFFKIKCHEFVMRFVTVYQDGPGSAEYKRPEAVDISSSRRMRTNGGGERAVGSEFGTNHHMMLEEGVTEEVTDQDMKNSERTENYKRGGNKAGAKGRAASSDADLDEGEVYGEED